MEEKNIGFISLKEELDALEEKLQKFAENIEAIVEKLGLEKPDILKGKLEYTVFFWNKQDSNQRVKMCFLMDGTAEVKLCWQDKSQGKKCYPVTSIQELFSLREEIRKHLGIE